MTRALPARRLRRYSPLLALFGAALLTAACTTTPSPVPTPGTTADPSSGATGGATTIVRAYFFLGSFTSNGGLVPVERVVPALQPAGSVERAALDALLAGPNDTELGASPALYTQMPEGTRVLGLDFEGTIATVDLSSEFAGAGSASAKGRLAQVVYTLTQFPAITGVRFKLDGVPVTIFSDAGLDLRAPVDRTTYTDQLPSTFVDQPAWGGALGNPARLVGLSNAFEATFQVRILDATGRSLADGPVMASCGTGCWGTFNETIAYSVPAVTSGTLEVYELSAADGSIINLTAYPVRLTP